MSQSQRAQGLIEQLTGWFTGWSRPVVEKAEKFHKYGGVATIIAMVVFVAIFFNPVMTLVKVLIWFSLAIALYSAFRRLKDSERRAEQTQQQNSTGTGKNPYQS